MNQEMPVVRLSILGIVIVSLFAALFSRLWYLQVMDSTTYKVAAKQNQVKVVFEPAPRGRILDRNGAVLVDNRYRFVVTLSRVSVKKDPEVVNKLAALLNMSLADVNRRVGDQRYSEYKPAPIADDVPKELAIYLKERHDEYPGVDVVRVAERTYPQGTLAAQLLGNVGQVTSEEASKLKSKGYRDNDEIGRAGVEKLYEEYLRGTPGQTKLAVDATGAVLPKQLGPPKPPIPGHDVQLTIDMDTQRLAEESLAQGLDAARAKFDPDKKKKFVAPGGGAVVLDPNDGSVIALASNPTFDPAAFVGGIKQATFDELQKPENNFPLNNRAIQGQYAPGSTFKLFTAIAALDKGLIDPRTTVDDQGVYKIPPPCLGERCVYKNAQGAKNGRINLARALTVSSDVFFYSLGAKMWQPKTPGFGDPIQDAARSLGLGRPTGIGLVGEQAGRVWKPADRVTAHEKSPAAFPNKNWRTGDNINLSVGQGETAVTPLQLASAYGAFATGGELATPRLAFRVLDEQKRTVASPVGFAKTTHVELPAARDAILQGFVGVVGSPGGTAYGAFAGFPLNTLQVAGKTGTAQAGKDKSDTALFVSFGPAAAPKWVVAVVMEEAGFGGSTAAPVSRRIWDGLAKVPPTNVSLTEGGAD